MKKLTAVHISIALAIVCFLSFKPGRQPNTHLLINQKQSNMKEFILLNRVPLNYGPDDAKVVIAQWNTLTDKWKADGIFISSFVFPRQGFVVSGSGPTQTVKQQTVASDNLKMVSCIIIRAHSFEEAIEHAKACPILGQGGSIEVSEVQSRPMPAKE